MFGRRRITDLERLLRVRTAERDAARIDHRDTEVDAQELRATVARQGAEIAELRKKLAVPAERVTVTALREELSAQKRVNERLANQLLDAVGHNGQALTASQRAALSLPTGGAR
ncbi:hypothetical protein [Streptomyces virginiae]|uniref:Atg14 domain-containing protein n=1 Tax=Streptomyces virginiae TaxID=1961 RepID=A0ABZ1TF91_STRVG|nr:hypothetical protein [Streptomyces virginiae]